MLKIYLKREFKYQVGSLKNLKPSEGWHLEMNKQLTQLQKIIFSCDKFVFLVFLQKDKCYFTIFYDKNVSHPKKTFNLAVDFAWRNICIYMYNFSWLYSDLDFIAGGLELDF